MEKIDVDEDYDTGGGMGRRGDWIEISPEMGRGMPNIRIDGFVFSNFSSVFCFIPPTLFFSHFD